VLLLLTNVVVVVVVIVIVDVAVEVVVLIVVVVVETVVVVIRRLRYSCEGKGFGHKRNETRRNCQERPGMAQNLISPCQDLNLEILVRTVSSKRTEVNIEEILRQRGQKKIRH
jgi:hypothetical protein